MGSQKQYEIPVAVIVFNRAALAKKILACLEKIRPVKLFVIADGAREDVEGEAEKVSEVRALFEKVSWLCEVRRDYADHNMGCDYRVPTGLTWVFQQVEQAVVLEDDCIPSDDFFRFAEEALEHYRDEPRVMMVAGSNEIQKYKIPDSCCLVGRAYTWGWATWKRAWAAYCDDPSEWLRIQRDGTFERLYPKRIRECIRKEIDFYMGRGKCPWDYLWWISMMGRGGLCVMPKENLIVNEGFGGDATHTRDKAYHGTYHKMDFPLRFPGKVVRDTEYDRYDEEICRPRLAVRALRRLKRLIWK